jgi:MYXO-CTERM domain-containing protein
MAKTFWALGTLMLCSIPAFGNGVGSDVLQVYDNHGNSVCDATANEQREDGDHVYYLHYFDCLTLQSLGGVVNTGQFGNYTQLMDPGGSRSDVFGIANIGSSYIPIYVFGFTSDGGGEQASTSDFYKSGGTVTTLDEGNGGPFDATKYLPQYLQSEGWSATFTSDSEVPEPASMGLASGLVVLGLLAWRRRRAV